MTGPRQLGHGIGSGTGFESRARSRVDRLSKPRELSCSSGRRACLTSYPLSRGGMWQYCAVCGVLLLCSVLTVLKTCKGWRLCSQCPAGTWTAALCRKTEIGERGRGLEGNRGECERKRGGGGVSSTERDGGNSGKDRLGGKDGDRDRLSVLICSIVTIFKRCTLHRLEALHAKRHRPGQSWPCRRATAAQVISHTSWIVKIDVGHNNLKVPGEGRGIRGSCRPGLRRDSWAVCGRVAWRQPVYRIISYPQARADRELLRGKSV